MWEDIGSAQKSRGCEYVRERKTNDTFGGLTDSLTDEKRYRLTSATQSEASDDRLTATGTSGLVSQTGIKPPTTPRHRI